jgi:predicted RNase H-like nuclease (RuvC/YqgF family)
MGIHFSSRLTIVAFTVVAGIATMARAADTDDKKEIARLQAELEQARKKITELEAQNEQRDKIAYRRQKNFEVLIAELQQSLNQMSALNERLQRELDRLLPQTHLQAPIPVVEGKIVAMKVINGIPYATISVGQSNAVQKGMKFKVMDGKEEIGELIIDLAETDQSVGHLIGPKVDKAKPGAVVKS